MPGASEFLEQFGSSLEGVELPGRILAAYRPESCLAQREDGAVWLLRRRADGERVVLRICRDGSRDLGEEFRVMGRLPAGLDGRVPGAVDLFEEGGAQYLLRTYLPGTPLDEAAEREGRRSWEAVGRDLCALLERLHGLDPPVIHRDIKPENIIIAPDGSAGLIDFGIARSYDPERDTDTVHMGTRATAAPEQYGFAQSDQRTDLYALGVTLRWMATGSYRPEAVDSARLSAAQRRFLRRAAAFDPARRFPDAAAMGRALGRLTPARVGLRRLAPALLALCLLAAGSLALSGRFAGPTPPEYIQNQPEAVEFASSLLEAAVRAELDMPEGDITPSDLERVQRLAVVGQQMLREEWTYDYRIQGFIEDGSVMGGVPQADMPRGDIQDLSLLSEMPNLTQLYLCQQKVRDLSPLEGLPLRELYLCDNMIRDLSPLSEISTLETLYIGGNPATDLSPLSALASLRRLNIDSGDSVRPVEHLDALAGLPVEFLSAGLREPVDGGWSALGEMEALESLFLWDPGEGAIAALGSCEALVKLRIGDYGGGDLTALPEMPGLESLQFFNRITSLEGVERQRGLNWLALCGVADLDLGPVARLPRLCSFHVAKCHFSDFGPLASAPSLNAVYLDEANRADFEATCPDYAFSLSYH